ncbi:MAG: hypothetical protein JXA11_01180, partial [Phycisphaerae bacterium]|nr:hypothetical protein [Phycisphaerae bacterium]
MTKETRVGLLVGLVIVIVFGMILTEFKGTDAPFENLGNAENAASPGVIETDYYRAGEPPQPEMAFSPSPQQAGLAIHLESNDDPTPAPANEPIQIRVLPRNSSGTSEPVAAMIRRNPDEQQVEPQPTREPQPVRLESTVELARRESPPP